MFINRTQSEYDFIDLDAQPKGNNTLQASNTHKLRLQRESLGSKEALFPISKNQRPTRSESQNLYRKQDNWMLNKNSLQISKNSTFQNFYLNARAHHKLDREKNAQKNNEVGKFKITGPVAIQDNRRTVSQNTTKENFSNNLASKVTEIKPNTQFDSLSELNNHKKNASFNIAKPVEYKRNENYQPNKQLSQTISGQQNMLKKDISNTGLMRNHDTNNQFTSTGTYLPKKYNNIDNIEEENSGFSQTAKEFNYVSNSSLSKYNKNYIQGQIGLIKTQSQVHRTLGFQSFNEPVTAFNKKQTTISSVGSQNRLNSTTNLNNDQSRKPDVFNSTITPKIQANGMDGDSGMPSEYLLKQQSIEKQFIMKKIDNKIRTTNFESYFEKPKSIIDTPDQKFNKIFENVSVRSKPGFNGHYAKTNQDASHVEREFLRDQSSCFFSVYDGHGEYGHRVAQYLKKQQFDNFSYQIKTMQSRIIFNPENQKHIETLLKNTFVKTNDELNKKMGQFTDLSGSTGNAVQVVNNVIYCANVGDSRAAILSREPKNWNLLHLSTDHVPSIPQEKQRILAMGGRIEPSKMPGSIFSDRGPLRVWKQREDAPGLMMSRSFGDKVGHSVGIIATPEITMKTYQPTYKALIVASDGVWGVLSDTIVSNILAKHSKDSNSEAAAQEIITRSSNEWKLNSTYRDDITVVVAYWQKEQDYN